MRTRWLWGTACYVLLFSRLAVAQQSAPDDGFQRRNGQMQVVRNGRARPMTHDARLPTGAIVTKDGFLVAPNGQRTELREGQGCNLRGQPVAVRTAASGRLILASSPRPASPPRATVVRNGPAAVLEALFGSDDENREFYFNGKKWKKRHGKGKGHGHGKEKEHKEKDHWKEEDDD